MNDASVQNKPDETVEAASISVQEKPEEKVKAASISAKNESEKVAPEITTASGTETIPVKAAVGGEDNASWSQSDLHS